MIFNAKISMRRRSTRWSCAGVWAWSFRSRTLPKSIYDNIAWGAKINGFHGDMDDLVEASLRNAALWDGEGQADQSALGFLAGNSSGCALRVRSPSAPTSS